jgi:hypothetical protein
MTQSLLCRLGIQLVKQHANLHFRLRFDVGRPHATARFD